MDNPETLAILGIQNTKIQYNTENLKDEQHGSHQKPL